MYHLETITGRHQFYACGYYLTFNCYKPKIVGFPTLSYVTSVMLPELPLPTKELKSAVLVRSSSQNTYFTVPRCTSLYQDVRHCTKM
jgi:hypothetical protein